MSRLYATLTYTMLNRSLQESLPLDLSLTELYNTINVGQAPLTVHDGACAQR